MRISDWSSDVCSSDLLTDIKIKAGTTGLLMIGGGVPKNFIQDTVVCAEILGHDDVEVHKYAVQITVADVRDGACSSSTLQEAASWGKVSTAMEQMVRSEEHTSELQSLMRISYAVFCLKKKKTIHKNIYLIYLLQH